MRGAKRMTPEATFGFLALVLFWENASGTSSSARIALPQGFVAGITVFADPNARVNAFLGLPYALPPIGDLRFAPPEKHPGWNRTLFAGHFRPDCPQPRQDGQESEAEATNEDCLYLNVFVPEGAPAYGNLPVVVFVNGVDYVTGSPLIVSAEELAKEGLVVVTFSYRLNVFGFLTFEDEHASGNLGLLDQYMVLVWVKQNVRYFGGLPNNVTLMGHGSGASSVLVHMTSPRTKNLFQRVILMSGSVTSPWLKSHQRSKSHPALLASRAIARSLGCYGESYRGLSSKSVLACMRQKSGDEVSRAFHSAYQNGNWSNALGPVSDDFLPAENQYLPMDPTEAIRTGKYHRVPILTGITRNEGTIELHKWRELVGQNDEVVSRFVASTAIGNAMEKYEVVGPESRALITWNYLKKSPEERKPIRQLLQLYNDAMFSAPFWRQTQLLLENNDVFPVFVYVFAHGSFDYFGNYGELLELRESGHGAELPFLFGPALFQRVSGRRFTPGEERLSIKMKRLWAYFVRFGDPTPPSYGHSLWDRYDVRRESHLELYVDLESGRNLKKATGNPDKEAATFWNCLLPEVHAATQEKAKRLEELLVLAGAADAGADSGACGSYKSAMFTTLAFLILLLVMLVLALVFLQKRTKERDRSIL